ncbi:hypothetical protein ENSA7_05650 [Enhygromyxa salina]|uniref:DUF4375 domain-containing protein n=1 Tax=Enhygromyxa salina TaxID=215803 RepID=A0A2S9YXK2_9BACT|nr:hypothetical protein ENSA7_05650 [Enhygromyxa salina]
MVVAAIAGLFESERDFFNGGADQFVWNHGPGAARSIGSAWRAVGAVENGELLIELANALERLEAARGWDDDKPIRAFIEYRRLVAGPDFGRPEPAEELAEALVEWAIEHPEAFVSRDVNVPTS